MQKGGNVGTLLLAGVGALVLLAGCASTKPFLGFIATTGYVDQKMQVQAETNQRSLDRIESDLQAMQAQLSRYEDQSTQIKQLMDELAKTQSQTQRLEQLAASVGDRIAGLPRETLLQLASLIQQQLGTSTTARPAAK